VKCDNCGRELEPDHRVVTSNLGLDVWNRVCPEDQRTELHTCDDACTLQLGRCMGWAIRGLSAATDRQSGNSTSETSAPPSVEPPPSE
jgi:hypothetical protein